MGEPARQSERLHAAERREVLLDAALHVFLEKGYTGASMHDLAQRAGITEALIYRHFKSKREMLLALINERSPAAAVTGLGDQPGRESLEAALDDLMRRVLDAFESDAEILLLLFGQSMIDDDVADVWAQVVKEGAAVIATFLARLKRAEAIAEEVPVDMAAQLLISSCLMFFLNTRRLRVPGLVTDRERYIEASVALFGRALTPTKIAEGRPQATEREDGSAR